MNFGSNGKKSMKTFYSHKDEVSGRGGTAWLFTNTYGLTQVSDPKDADIIVWNGGADIATSIYGEQPVGRGIPFELSSRDRNEIELFNKFKDDKTKLLVGICRGGQLLNVLNGGTLYQDVDRHGRDHLMVDTRSGEILNITSTHHQQFRPDMHVAQVIGLSAETTYQQAEEGVNHPKHTTQNLMGGQDVEIVWYPDHRSLCIQGHPEYVPGSRFSDYTLGLLKEFFPAKAA